jgi:hypothetical protein
LTFDRLSPYIPYALVRVEAGMHALLMAALLVLLPVAVDAVIVTEIRIPNAAVDVTVTAAGIVPLPSGSFAIADTFVLHGTGAARQLVCQGCSFVRTAGVEFNASSGGVTAFGTVFVTDGEFETRESALQLTTPKYELSFFPGDHANAFCDNDLCVFSAFSEQALVGVGAESGTLIGTASFQGIAVPEPAVGMLLVLGAIGVVLATKTARGTTAARLGTRS